MTRDDVIRMAREADADEHYVSEADDMPWSVEFSLTNLEAFAALVAAAEREACAAFIESGVDLAGLAGDPMMQAFTGKLLIGCAKAIRARGDV